MLEQTGKTEQADILICSDIFGGTDDLQELAGQVVEGQSRYRIIGPYLDETKHFVEEGRAYQAFVKAGGVEAYARGLAGQLDTLSSPTVLIGFSAGAAAIWKALGNKHYAQVARFIGFYPGQIRHYLCLTPGVDTQLYFPNAEAHFDLDDVIKKLTGKKAVSLLKTPYSHGFMNRLSVGYHPRGYQEFILLLKQQLN